MTKLTEEVRKQIYNEGMLDGISIGTSNATKSLREYYINNSHKEFCKYFEDNYIKTNKVHLDIIGTRDFLKLLCNANKQIF